MEKLGLQNDQKALTLWDAFKGQSTDKVTKELKRLNFIQFMVPKKVNHFLQPFDLMINASVKKIEKKCFSEYSTNALSKEMLCDPKRDVATIEVDLRLSTLKPEHAKVMSKLYEFLNSEKSCDVIKADWRAAGITASHSQEISFWIIPNVQ